MKKRQDPGLKSRELIIVKMAHVMPIFHKFSGDRLHHRLLSKLLLNVAQKVTLVSNTRMSSKFVNWQLSAWSDLWRLFKNAQPSSNLRITSVTHRIYLCLLCFACSLKSIVHYRWVWWRQSPSPSNTNCQWRNVDICYSKVEHSQTTVKCLQTNVEGRLRLATVVDQFGRHSSVWDKSHFRSTKVLTIVNGGDSHPRTYEKLAQCVPFWWRLIFVQPKQHMSGPKVPFTTSDTSLMHITEFALVR